MKKNKFKWPAKGEFLGLGKKIFSWLPFFVACGFTLFAAVFFIVPAEDVEASGASTRVTLNVTLPFDFTVNVNGTFPAVKSDSTTGNYTATCSIYVDSSIHHAITITAKSSDVRLFTKHLVYEAVGAMWMNGDVGDISHDGLDLGDTDLSYRKRGCNVTTDTTALNIYLSSGGCYARKAIITGDDEISRDALDYFRWSDRHTTEYKASNGSMTVPFWCSGNYAPSEGAKLFIDPKYTLENATITVSCNGGSSYTFYGVEKHKEVYKDEAVRGTLGIGVSDYYIAFPTVSPYTNSTNIFYSVSISGVTHCDRPCMGPKYVRQAYGETDIADYSELSAYCTDGGIVTVDMDGYTVPLYLLDPPSWLKLSPYYDFSNTTFSCYDSAKLDSTKPLASRFTDSAKLDSRLYTQDGANITFKHAVKEGTSGYNLEYDGYGSDTTVVVVISGVKKFLPIPKGVSFDCSDLKGSPLFTSASDKETVDFFKGQLSAGFGNSVEIGSYFSFGTQYTFTCTSNTALYDVSSYTIKLYSDSGFSTPIDAGYFSIEKSDNKYTLTFSKNNMYYGDVYILVSGVATRPIFNDLKIDCSDLKESPLFTSASDKETVDFFKGQLSAGFSEPMASNSYFFFDTPYEFKCTSKAGLYDVLEYTITLYSDSGFSTLIDAGYFSIDQSETKCTLTFSKNNMYHGNVYILVSGIKFQCHDFSISQDSSVTGIKQTIYQPFAMNDDGSWSQTDTSTGLTTSTNNSLPNNHAFEFDINYTAGYQYNMEELGYMYGPQYTWNLGEKINNIILITKASDTSDAAVTYNFIFYDDRLHISIPENVITSDITVTIKQGPEKFADCLNSFSFENENVKNNVSVHSMQVVQLSTNNKTAIVGGELEYEIVKNSKSHYYAIKLAGSDSESGYNYVFDNFGVQSSQGAEVTILKGEDLEKIGLKDEDHIRYIRVYLGDPAATSHVISFTGIYIALKSVEITLSDGIKDMEADSFVGAINTQFSTENKKWTMNVYHGQYLNFTIAPKEGYYLNRSDILSVTPKDGLYEAKLDELGSDMGILIHNIRDDIKLEVKVQQAPLSITFENVEGFEYHSVGISEGNINSVGEQILATVNVAPSSDYYFAVKANNGYDLTTVVLKNYDSDLNSISGPNDDYKYYKLEKIQQHAKISGTIDKIKYNIKFNKSAHGTLPGSEESEAVITYTQDGEKISSLKIVHGESISFEVGLEDRFSSSNIKVYSTWEDGSKEEIFVSGDIYTLSNIMHDCEIYVEGIELNRYVINFAQNDKVQYELDGKLKASGAVSVKHGDDYTFKLIPKKGYQITDKTIVNQKTVEGTTSLKSTSAGSYTISNMLQDCTITVENAEDIIYKISFKNQGGVTYRNRDGDVITESLSIKYGENFEFAVELDDAYDDSIQGMKPIANDDKSINSRVNKLAEGKYLISNVIEDINLEVLNVRKNRYTVSLVKMEGVDFHNSNGKVITGPNEVEHGESLNFKVYVYPAYDGSKLKVMLGDNPLAAQTAGDYLVEGVTENKTVTVIGVEESLVTRLINTINNLPNPISDLDDVDKVIEASKMYQLIPADQRHLVTNISVLNGLQEQSKSFHHVNNGITVDGVSWRIKLVAVPISSSTEACARIYKKLDSEYVLSLYDVYFWDTVNEVRYTPAKEQTISLTLPKPDLKYFENATGVCGDAKGDVNFLSLSFSGDSVHLNTNSPGYIGVIADRTSTPGRSSLLDAADANWETLTNALSSFGIGSPKEDASQGTSIFNDIENDSDANDIIQEGTGNISEKYKSRNNKVTAQGSAIRLVLVLMIVILVAVIVWVIVKKRKERKEMDN